jgi:hypothetical protein
MQSPQPGQLLPSILAPRLSTETRDVGFTIKAQTLLNPDDSVPGVLLFARRQP